MKWQDLEKLVKQYAQVIWLSNAVSETINGIRCDCVLKKKKDYWVIIEISKSSTLTKLRTDLAKFASIRPYLLSQDIYTECIFISEKDVSSLRSTSEGNKIKLYKINEFFDNYFGSDEYKILRKSRPFGSAIDPDDGSIDISEYIPINYIDNSGKIYNIKKIADNLRSGKKIIITGEFGSGKSRCIMEVFKYLTETNSFYPSIAINLRDAWGLKSYHTIISEHFSSIGLNDYSQNIIRSIIVGNNIILLDGFDELGSQSWSGDKKRIREVRRRSFEGVRDLIYNTKKSGVLITGREHYFNDNNEMFECLGINKQDSILLKCPDEFSEEETREYLSKKIGIHKYPQWFPRKPLLCQVLTKLDRSDVDLILNDESGEIKYFEKTLDLICCRETKFNPSVFADSVKELYFELSRMTKEKESRVGPLTITDVYNAFERVTGSPPLDDSIVLLQRLAYLGRTDASSEDRVFIDEYIADGLTALSMVNNYYKKVDDINSLKWKNSLSYFGLKIIGNKIKINDESILYIKDNSKNKNIQIASDFFAGMINENFTINMKNTSIDGANIKFLDLSSKNFENFILNNPAIENLVIEDSTFKNIKIINGTFNSVTGVTSISGLPSFFINCDSIEFEKAKNSANIANLSVSNEHKTLLIIVKKLFFQPGSGRKEEALLRGTEKYWDNKAALKIINFMVSSGIVEKSKGDTGYVYRPNRKQTIRLGRLYSQLNNSDDEIWDLLN